MREVLDDLCVTHSMGGLHRFQKTGVYPNDLKVVSFKYDHVWRIKVKEEIQKGVLRVSKVVVYNYVFDNDIFKAQAVDNGLPVSDWVEVYMTKIMVD